MPFIYDNLVATVIAMTVALILASIQMEAMRANTAQTSRTMVNVQAQQLSSWLEEDLSKIGQNMSPAVSAYEEPKGPKNSNTDWSDEWHTTEFSFEYRDSTGTLKEVKYELVKTSEKVVIENQDNIPLARLERSTGGSPDGQASNLGYFRVDFLDEHREPGASGDDIALIRARFSVIAPFQNESTIPRRARRSVTVSYRSN